MFQFKDVIGQNELKTELIQSVQSGKVHHAHLFLGSMGYGTYSIALAFLKYNYCTQRTEQDSCGVCDNCMAIDRMELFDIFYTFPTYNEKNKNVKVKDHNQLETFRKFTMESNGLADFKDWIDYVGVDTMKITSESCAQIIQDMSMTSFSGGLKTEVIWYFELLKKEQNKLLKILEEPNPNTMFIMVAESSQDILPTVLSRCTIHKVPALSNEHVESYLNQLGENKHEIKEAVRYSQGDLIEAKRYLEEEVTNFNSEEEVLLFLKGMINFNQRKLSNIHNAFDVIEKLIPQNRSTIFKFFEYFSYILRRIIWKKYSQQADQEDKMSGAVNYFAENLEIDQLEYWIELVDEMPHLIDGNANKRITFASFAIKSGKLQTRNEFESLISNKERI